MRRWIIATFIVALLGGAIVVALPRITGSRAAEDTIDGAAATASPAATALPAAISQVEAEAKLVPEHSAVLSLPIDGTVSQVLAAEGERVEAGQLLARLDASSQAAAVARAEAGLRRAQADLDELKAGPRPPEVEAAQATVAGAEAQAELAKNKFGTSSQQASIARAEVRRTAAELALTQAGERGEDVAAAAEAVTAAQAALEQARRSVADTELRAPFPGTLAQLDLRAGENVAATAPVGNLADFSTWQVETDNLPEQSVFKVYEGAAATVTFAAVPGLELAGTVTQVKPIGENKQGDIVYTAVVRLDQLDDRLRWNMTASVAIQTDAAAGTFPWPDYLPDGMALAVDDSWPFRALAPEQTAEPFLIFRDRQRWILIRDEAGDAAPASQGAALRSISVAGAPALLSRSAGDSFTLVVNRAGRLVRISGAGVGDDEIVKVAESLRALSADQLQAKVAWEAARRDPRLTLLWPTVVPDSMQLDAAASSPQPSLPLSDQAVDSYVVTFRGPNLLLQVGGNVEPPELDGTKEQIAVDSLSGELTVASGKLLLVVDAGQGGVAPQFWTANGTRRLPPIQQGRFYVLAENIDRSRFDEFVAGLAPVRPEEFQARLRGQSLSSLTYFWPSRLPDGYRVDRRASQSVSFDRVLQGEPALFSLAAHGTDGSTVTIKGGRESSGAPFIVPEGSDVERVTATIHGRSASAAHTAAGTIIIWSEQDAYYAISSRELSLEQLLEIGEALEPVSLAEFNRRLQ